MIEKIITAEKAKTIDSVLNNEPDRRVLKAFNRIGKVLYFYQPKKEKKKLDNLDKVAKKICLVMIGIPFHFYA